MNNTQAIRTWSDAYNIVKLLQRVKRNWKNYRFPSWQQAIHDTILSETKSRQDRFNITVNNLLLFASAIKWDLLIDFLSIENNLLSASMLI